MPYLIAIIMKLKMKKRNLKTNVNLEALELREDLHLSKVAQKLDRDNVKTYSHDEARKDE